MAEVIEVLIPEKARRQMAAGCAAASTDGSSGTVLCQTPCVRAVLPADEPRYGGEMVHARRGRGGTTAPTPVCRGMSQGKDEQWSLSAHR
ncbi:hypothetical protein SAMN05421595_1723 [Austwickia chelonae]|uniref:Uncharacterized protein n=1 Tax=Austwickia chelonae NBRC 105200 TaxID=1184607 RepID=K6W465_9MICO|nr:hypothetical protein AUCHE_01_01540 [Austwickia chelonae NBRC 105200]SEW27565.1 hypothetical protein SAMN05421595_1723 [Austwickia chelonae]